MGYIYKLTCIITQKSYVGLTTGTVENRWKKHIYDATVSGRTQAIHHAIAKYGPENFEKEVLFQSNSLEELNKAEENLINLENTLSPNGYNLHTGGNVHRPCEQTLEKQRQVQLGKKQSEYTKAKRSKALKGKKQSPKVVASRIKALSKPIKETVSGLEFSSIKEAANYFCIRAKGISKNLHKKSKHYFGKKFEFLEL